MRELLAEVLVLWTLGAALGALVAGWAVHLLVALAPPDTPRLGEVALDARVLLFALGSALATGLAFGLWPALMATRWPRRSLREGGRTAGLARRKAAGALVVGEMALALVLLMGAGLALGSLRRLITEPPGFDPDGVLTAELSLLSVSYPNGEARDAFYTALLDRLRGLPGVTGAALVTPLPLSGDTLRAVVTLPDRPLPPADRPNVIYHAISPDYFSVMRIPVLRGRAMDAGDRRGGAAVAVVSATAAETLFPGVDPLGRDSRWASARTTSDPSLLRGGGRGGRRAPSRRCASRRRRTSTSRARSTRGDGPPSSCARPATRRRSDQP